MRLVLVSTSGNQRFVFASNKLREAVGASHLVALSTTVWVHEALDGAGTILQESSGTTLVQVEDEETARDLATALTRRVRTEAPGLDLSVVSVLVVDGHVGQDEVDAVFQEAHRHRSNASFDPAALAGP